MHNGNCVSINLSSCIRLWRTPFRISTVFTIIFENQGRAKVLSDPYFLSLKERGYFMSNYHAVSHPSQPNYIALVSGSTNGCRSDFSIDIGANSIVDLLEAKGLTWKAYNEGFPGNCFTESYSDRYVRKHNPFMSFNNIRNDPKRCANIVSADELKVDEQTGTLPNYILFTPDMDNDGHDTGVPYSSAWLKEFLEPKLANPVYANTLFHITYDEDGYDTLTNNIYSLFLGKGILAKGVVDNTWYTHYSALATVEELFGLGSLGKGDATTRKIPLICNSTRPSFHSLYKLISDE
ncbi:hypothetical protein BCR33DRAFT_520845 [Rhizoclosmatium globosum]|uniref:Phosphoesterase-domain-containing protein n=1 Tax=Rhizoclosmatium globosum TaxID=329046 RepID=A0A1Y2BEG2_9FUNG|nr:hypothetical protein BCR33DRAFT_520845 [Rhizoclosmatium globosum]|eukprot:ORY33211.1 hypothetical protein BCR33DRAFT_520845 [Rhizoclosmatium globosum]